MDNQLRGRAGRQGDPGSSRFYLSLEDNLMRIFASDWVQKAMRGMGMKENDVIESGLVTKQIANAQRKVEAHNFDIRKNLLDYDDVANDQRKVIYQQRNELLDAADIADTIAAMRQGVIHDLFREYVPAESVEEQWNLGGLEVALVAELTLKLPVAQWVKDDPKLNDDDILRRILDAADAAYAEKVAKVDLAAWRGFERSVMLQSLDTHWREHLAALDHLRQGIHLRGYAQKNPKQEYKREAFELFEALLGTIRNEVTRLLMTVEIRSEAQIEEAEQHHPQVENVQYHHADYDEALAAAGAAEKKPMPQERAMPKVGRNDPCPCGSGKKYKHCHGKLS
jgi:preprotein translocase subunit SecA